MGERRWHLPPSQWHTSRGWRAASAVSIAHTHHTCLEVFGPAAGLAILGVVVMVWLYKPSGSDGYLPEDTAFLVRVSCRDWGLGIRCSVSDEVSDRALLLFPLPIVSSLGMLWLVDHVPKLQRFPQTRLLAVCAVIIPLLTVPVVFAYTTPHFTYFVEHGTSFVTCGTS